MTCDSQSARTSVCKFLHGRLYKLLHVVSLVCDNTISYTVYRIAYAVG